MLTHRGFSAWVVSNGMILPEHLVAVDEQCHRVSCWIPGTEGHVRSSLILLNLKLAQVILLFDE